MRKRIRRGLWGGPGVDIRIYPPKKLRPTWAFLKSIVWLVNQINVCFHPDYKGMKCSEKNDRNDCGDNEE